MADAQTVPASGFNIPGIPATASSTGGERPAPGNEVPGFVPQVQTAPTGLTQEQVQARITAALAAAAPKAPESTIVDVPDNTAFDASAITASGDPVLTSLSEIFFQVGKGIDIERALGNALKYGNSALIDTAYINEKGGPQATQLATLAKAIVDRIQVQTTAASASVYETAGGQAQWDTAAAVFDKQAPKHLKMVIANMLDSGNSEAIKAAAQSVVDYVKQSGSVVNPAQLINAGATSANAGQALSKSEFQDAHAKLDVNGKNYLQERNALFARRQLGKQLGK